MKFVNKVKFYMLIMAIIAFCGSELFASMQSLKKNAHSVNRSPIAKIKKVIKNDKGFQSPQASILVHCLSRLQESAGGSKQKISRKAANFTELQLLDERDENLEQENNQLLRVYIDSAHKKKRSAVQAMECAVANLPINEQQQYCAIDTNHVLYPHQIKDSATRACIGISGGHNIDQYLSGEVDTPCILSNNKKLGVFVNLDSGRKVGKTVGYELRSKDIIKTVKKSTLVATSSDDSLKITKTPEGDFYGSYIDPKNPLICKTQFPLLVVNRDARDEQNNIIIGILANLQPDYKGIQDRHVLSVSSRQFDAMMQSGTSVNMKVKDMVMKDITGPIELKFSSDLSNKGFHKGRLPGRIYGIKKIQS